MTPPASERATSRVDDLHTADGQLVRLLGDERARPTILVVSGPGFVTSPLAGLFAPWAEHFNVALWDQPAGPGLTLERLAADGLAAAEAVRARRPDAPLVLFATSGGTIPGLMMAKARPDLFAAYVGHGQVTSWARQARSSYAIILDRARATRDAAAIAEIEGIGPPPWADVAADAVRGKYANAPTTAERAAFADPAVQAAFAQLPPDLRDRATAAFAALKPQIDAFDAGALGFAYDIPMVFLLGEHDAHLPTSDVQAFATRLRAPRVEVVVMPGLGHMAGLIPALTAPYLASLVRRPTR